MTISCSTLLVQPNWEISVAKMSEFLVRKFSSRFTSGSVGWSPLAQLLRVLQLV